MTKLFYHGREINNENDLRAAIEELEQYARDAERLFLAKKERTRESMERMELIAVERRRIEKWKEENLKGG